jgi:mannose-1-phosphate guanylyltransferase
MARAMVLAAGFGTRLRPLTEERPKPLLPLGDRMLLEHILERLAEQGFSQVVANAHHLTPTFRELASGLAGLVAIVEESSILGTAGGIANARRWLEGPLVVWNGDIVTRLDLSALLAGTPSDGLVLAVAPRAAGEGTVGIGDGDRVVRLRGERFGDERRGGDDVCVAGIGCERLAALPDEGCLIGDVALPMLRSGRSVKTFAVDGEWDAPGDSIADYLDANARWLVRRVGAGNSFVHPEALVDAGVEVVSSVIGAGARAIGDGRVERCVVWPGATVRAPLSDAVVTTGGRVVAR